MWVNDHLVRLVGAPGAADLMGRRIEDIFEGDGAYRSLYSDLTLYGIAIGRVVSLRHSGSPGVVVSMLPRFNSQGGLDQVFLVLRPLKGAETWEGVARTRALDDIAILVEASPDPSYLVDRHHRVLAWNLPMANFSGVERDLVIGTSRHRQALVLPYFLLPPLTDLAGLSESALILRCPRCRRAGRHTLAEIAAPGRYGGRAGVLLASASPVIKAEGKTVAVLGSVREISRWIEGTNPSVRVQESDLDDASALTASTSLVHSLYRNPDRAATSTLQSGALGLIRNPLLILDERGWVIDANQAYCELTGSDCGVLQQRGSFLSCVAPEDRRSLAGALQDEEHGKSFRIKVLTSSGRRPGLLCLSPVSRKEGGQGGFLPSFSKTFLQEGSDAWVRGR